MRKREWLHRNGAIEMDVLKPIDVDVKCTANDVVVATRYFEDCRDFIVKYPPGAGS